MTLVVGLRHKGRITLVADSKLTPKEGKPRLNPYLEGALKLTILRESLCVGFAGPYDPDRLAKLVALRQAPRDEVIRTLRDWRENDFIVASLDEGCRLVTVKNGDVSEPAIEQVWIGNSEAFSAFQEASLQSGAPGKKDPTWRMLTSMQWAIELRRTPSVGGFPLLVASSDKGFRFAAHESRVGPEVLRVTSITVENERTTVNMTADAPVTTFTVQCCPGRAPTIGACGYFIVEARLGVLWPHQAPNAPQQLKARSQEDFRRIALENYDQSI